jgi:murein DD-endopeptidase MepM/ murein hydrolase activator NlpD
MPADPFGRIEFGEKVFGHYFDKVTADPSFFAAIPVIVPVPGQPVFSRKFGLSIDPFSGIFKRHNGIDLLAPLGTPVLSTAAGTVATVINDKTWGVRIEIQHALKLRTVYAHLGIARTSVGKRVLRGDIIGTVGASGLTTGPHLHYEIHCSDMPINPEQLFFPALDTTVAGS